MTAPSKVNLAPPSRLSVRQGPNSIALKIDRKTDRKCIRDLFPLLGWVFNRIFDRIFKRFFKLLNSGPVCRASLPPTLPSRPLPCTAVHDLDGAAVQFFRVQLQMTSRQPVMPSLLVRSCLRRAPSLSTSRTMFIATGIRILWFERFSQMFPCQTRTYCSSIILHDPPKKIMTKGLYPPFVSLFLLTRPVLRLCRSFTYPPQQESF